MSSSAVDRGITDWLSSIYIGFQQCGILHGLYTSRIAGVSPTHLGTLRSLMRGQKAALWGLSPTHEATLVEK